MFILLQKQKHQKQTQHNPPSVKWNPPLSSPSVYSSVCRPNGSKYLYNYTQSLDRVTLQNKPSFLFKIIATLVKVVRLKSEKTKR